MAPELAYGRHSAPAPVLARRAAVIAPLVRRPEGWSLVTTLRTDNLGTHAGQVSLPGGSVDPGESTSAAALREYEEELGAPSTELRLVGELSPVFLFVSNFAISPFVAVAPGVPVFRPSAHEVAEVVELPIRSLEEQASRTRMRIDRRGLVFDAPAYVVGGRLIWGATAVMIAELTAMLREIV